MPAAPRGQCGHEFIDHPGAPARRPGADRHGEGEAVTDPPLRAMRPIVLDTLMLEPQVAAHADEMFAVLSDPRIYEYENEPPVSLATLRERFARLESRASPDGRELWLNWVLRLRDGPAIGYLQATVYGSGRADVAYEMGSAWWGRGLASRAVQAMLDELIDHYGVRRLSAVLKSANHRSERLLRRLGFVHAGGEQAQRRMLECDEMLMLRECAADALCLRVFLPGDVASARALWQATPGVGLSSADEAPALQRFLARNPGCSQVATRGTTLVGALLAGHDGRRGWLHHVVVDAASRRRGIGRALVQRALAALHDAGVHKCHVMVFGANADGIGFWRAAAATERVELALFSLPTGDAG
jgi:[ribosomal protein S5]-alanine N-acetyltransferase